MDEQEEVEVEFQRIMSTVMEISSLAQISLEDDERWMVAEKRVMKMARSTSSKEKAKAAIMTCLLNVLRKPDLPELVADFVAKAMAACCGPCAAPPSLRTFIFSPSLTIQINEMDYVQGGLGWKVWGAALVLSQRLLALKDMVRGKNVLELGSGCGLCGLLLAKLGAAKVVLSDNVLDILLNLSKNISLLAIDGHSTLKPCREVNHYKFLSNQHRYTVSLEQHHQDNNIADYIYEKSTPEEDACSCLISVRKLDWIEESTMASHDSFIEIQDLEAFPRVAVDEKFDWVVGSDLLYDKKSSLSLAHVIHHRLMNSDSKALIIAPVREREMLKHFLEEVNQLDMLTIVEEVVPQEWSSCKLASCTLDGDDCLYEDGTMYGTEHYEGGIVALYITLKNDS